MLNANIFFNGNLNSNLSHNESMISSAKTKPPLLFETIFYYVKLHEFNFNIF